MHHRLRDLCGHDGQSTGIDRAKQAKNEAQQAHALARELEILRKAEQTFDEFKNSAPELRCDTEHLVEFDDETGRVAKNTVLPKFGLISAVISTPRANLRDDPALPAFREQIEFIHAPPPEYLDSCE